ncbi:MAG: periplasmic heavy metal sensor [Gracilimonas sp.]|uniref:Spy/CpxP family protein refolding chaperone n=1 Tax=Gracilimonas sp. TaxID=1974203 RepID=UPI001B026E80|nr:periplasmic heavy metal sensor [Gracilimonas sp.]MBO6587306.1 periplasmic heavy metal sensor [Gracilimonas sp.]MBO6614206.1 periplasmic heavy metal sensor [Gracilimonas sp.]
MKIETKFKWALTGFLVMVLLNAALLTTIWIKKSGNRDGRSYRDNDRNPNVIHRYMQRELQLTDTQADSLSALRKSHFQEMRVLRKELNVDRRAYFDFIMSDEANNDQKRDSILTELTNQYSLIENMFYTHMTDMKEILNSEQQERFEQLMRETFIHDRKGDNMPMPHRNR